MLFKDKIFNKLINDITVWVKAQVLTYQKNSKEVAQTSRQVSHRKNRELCVFMTGFEEDSP